MKFKWRSIASLSRLFLFPLEYDSSENKTYIKREKEIKDNMKGANNPLKVLSVVSVVVSMQPGRTCASTYERVSLFSIGLVNKYMK
jgi:hypothetical protein